jgi:dihydroxyacid dehydratase/phosphogluconate dehydratase
MDEFIENPCNMLSYLNGKELSLVDVFEGVGKVAAKIMSEDELHDVECRAMPGCGSCQGLYTANTMACMTEAMGMSLSGSAAVPAVDARKLELARETGEQILKLVKKDIKPRDIVTANSLKNAIRVDMALGGSTNTVLHLTALATEAGIPLTLETFNTISDKTPHICDMQPAGPYSMLAFYRAGGIPAILKRIKKNATVDELIGAGKRVKESDILLDGAIRDRVNDDGSETLTFNTVLKDNDTQRMQKTENVVIVMSNVSGYYLSETVTGRFYDSNNGYLNMTTSQPMLYKPADPNCWGQGPSIFALRDLTA